MNLTERYVLLCRELAQQGYVWNPRPGDWMLDTADESIGMLTTYIENAELLRRVNVQIPYGGQIREMLQTRGSIDAHEGDDVVWKDREGRELYRCTKREYNENDDEHSLAALVEDYRRHGA